MRWIRRAAFALVSVLLGVGSAVAQNGISVSLCGATAFSTDVCYRSAQALASAYPQVGIAAAGGSPVLGTEGTRGITLGFIPKTTGTLRLNAARLRLPELRLGESSETRTGVALVAKIETATRLYEGLSSGTVTGIGSLDLLLDAGVLPANGMLKRSATELGAGARLGLVRETFGLPGVALSAMVRHTARTAYGDDCGGSGCTGTGAGELGFSVTDVAARLTVGKRVGPVGLLGGAGLDRFSTHGDFAYRDTLSTSHAVNIRDHDTRWSLFADLSYALTVGSLVLEGGWMGGGDAIDGSTAGSGGFDPGRGTAFGSVGLRISL